MYQGKGNTKGQTRRRAIPSAQQQAKHIAHSILTRKAEGRTYSVEEYGIANMPEMIEMVARELNVIR